MFSRNAILADLLNTKLVTAKVGLIARGVADCSDIILAVEAVANTPETLAEIPLHVALVGYNAKPDNRSNLVIAIRAEDAVAWRNQPRLAGRIIVFVQGQADKLHSLNDFTTLGSHDLTAHLLQVARQKLAINQPQRSFWEALGASSRKLPLQMVEDFVNAVAVANDDLQAIPKNLWRLGLLRDMAVLDPTRKVEDRLQDNRKLIMELERLQKRSRQRMQKALVSDPLLAEVYTQLMAYYRRGDMTLLQNLRYEDIEQLLKASKSKETRSTQAQPSLQTTHQSFTEESSLSDEGPLRGKVLRETVADYLLEGQGEELRELANTLRQQIERPQDTPTPTLDGREVEYGKLNDDLHINLRATFSSDRWGGLLKTSKADLREALQYAKVEIEYEPYNPHIAGINDQSVVSLIQRFDEILQKNDFSDALDRLLLNRGKLAEDSDLLLVDPLLLFGAYDHARQALFHYIKGYTDLLAAFSLHQDVLMTKANEAFRFVATQILRWDTLYLKVQADSYAEPEWRAILTPLHPLHLWKYHEILRPFFSEDRPSFNEEEVHQLKRTIPDLPHLLHYLPLDPDQTGLIDFALPRSDELLNLPTYANRTNRYLGNDGIDYLEQLLKLWLNEAPYSRRQIRLALIDVPELPFVLGRMALFLETHGESNIFIDAYFTHRQQVSTQLAVLDYSERYHKLGEFLVNGRIKLRVLQLESVAQVVERLKQQPVHIAFVFDQSIYRAEKGPLPKDLVVSPLVITHEYKYDEVTKRGQIVPSSEAHKGLFANYYLLVKLTNSLQAGYSLRLQAQQDPDVQHVNAILRLQGSLWLAIADRQLVGYAPENSVQFKEFRTENREVGVWITDNSRAIDNIVRLLRNYSLNPDRAKVASLLERFAHLIGSGLPSLLRTVDVLDRPTPAQKGLIGTLLAAAWYQQQYPDALLASLDTEYAGQWLSKRTGSQERADLIGLRIAGERLIIEPIEVKTHQADAVHVQGQQLVGQAVNQIKESIAILRTVFIREEAQLLFTPARREVLQYQLYRECFRDQHKRRGESWPKEWTARLKSAFTQPQPELELSIEGIIVQVQLEQSHPLETQVFPDQKLMLITLGSDVIQPLVGHGQATPTPVLENKEQTAAQSIESIEGATEGALDKRAHFDGPLSETPASVDTLTTSTELDAQHAWITEKANKLEQTLRHFNVAVRRIDSELTEIGPSVVRYRVRLYPGEKIQKVQNIAEDLQRELAITAVPLIENISGTHFVGIDLPRTDPEIVSLVPLLTQLNAAKGDLPIILGLKPDGKLIVQDIAEMPHMLVAGETGSGKTMFLYTLIVSLMSRYPGNQLRLLLIDPKQTDFVFFDKMPNLIGNRVFIEPETAIEQLQRLLDEEIPRRRELFRERQVIKIQEFNRLNPANPMPFIVVVIDEYADLVQVLDRHERQTFERHVARMAQIARSFGIHLVVATQRPSADIVTSRIKANLTTRIAFRLPSHHDSMTILDQSGAQNLLGRGDMLVRQNEIVRIQAPLIERADLSRFIESIG